MADLFLIAGLGNPGRQYARTRHNVGFVVAEELGSRWKADWASEGKFKALVARAEYGGRSGLICRPQTYMNASGEAVRAVSDYYQVGLDRLLVVVDDADLPVGELRLRPQGSSGGHHGLESIIQHLGSREFARLRIGIGREPGAPRQITGYVLGRFNAGEAELMERVLERACDQIECWLRDGIGKAMSRFNGPAVENDEQNIK